MPKKQFELDQEVFEKDHGTIVLYRRPDHKNPRWNCRIAIKGVNNEYVRKSCRTVDKEQALKFAENLYWDLVVKGKQTGSIRSKPFRKVVKEFVGSMEHTNKSESCKREYRDRLNNYAVRFFGQKSIDQITSEDIADFVSFRREHGIRVKPSDTTIAKELAPLKQVFKFAQQRNYLTNKIEFPKLNGKGKIRPHFTKSEYQRLTRNLRSWVVESKKKHPRTYRERFYLQQYVLILSNCGCRIGEVRKLRWRDIQNIEITRLDSEEIEQSVCFWVSGKTGKRQVIPQPSTAEYLERLRKFRTKELGHEPPDEEFVFCHRNGASIGSFRKGFTAFLTKYDLLTDIEGNNHTLYSLRHTYAVFRISQEVNHYLLATNMGTGVEMLQKHYLKLSTIEHARELTKVRRKRT